jgi:hypothetical protein
MMKSGPIILQSSVYLIALAALALHGLGIQSAAKDRQFSITIEAPQKAKAGSEILVTVTLTNTSDQTLGFIATPSAPVDGYMIDVRDGNGKEVQETWKGKERKVWHASFSRIKKLRPGENWGTVFTVNEFLDLSRPGEYSIQLTREKVVSNQIMVRVVE